MTEITRRPGDVIVKSFDGYEALTGYALIVVYESPDDYPGVYVARLFDVSKGAGVVPQNIVAIKPSLDEIRKLKPRQMIARPRDAGDGACIVEMWM